MKKRYKITSKLSIKIILIHFAVVFLFAGVIYLIMRSFNIFENVDLREDQLVRIAVSLFPIVYGILITLTVSYILNITIVSRIRKLKSATASVAKGNFEDTIEVVGTDELSQLTHSFNKMTLELKANEYLSKDFVRNISHEYKTPLSVIKAYSELIGDEVNKVEIDKKIVNEYVQIIIDEADRMSALSKNILQLSLLDSTTIIKQDDIFSPAEQIRNILRASHVTWAQKNIDFRLQLDDEKIVNNEQLLYQVWQNLIQNAIKFSETDGEVIISLSIKDHQLHFEITDFGVGISKQSQENIFKHFYVADKSRNTEGSGLGLAIVKTIIDKLNGQVNYLNTDDLGTTFTIDLNF